MVHEFARRSGELRIELSTLPESSWPEDLELDRSEIARLAVLVVTTAPSRPLSECLAKSADVVCLDKFVLPANMLTYTGVLTSKFMELIGPDMYSFWNHSHQLSYLASLALTTTTISEVNFVFSELDAPILREVKFEDMIAGHEFDSDEEGDEEEDPVEIDLDRFDKLIANLTISRCRLEVWSQMCSKFFMPCLTSLTIVFDMYEQIDMSTFDRLAPLVSACARNTTILRSDPIS